MPQIPGMVFACKVLEILRPAPWASGFGGFIMPAAKKPNSHDPFAPARRSARLVPTQSVTVAVLDHGFPFAYGVVTNISETGACVMTDTRVGQGRIVTIRMSFYSHGDLLETAARIVWSDEEPGSPYGVPSAVLQGVQFTQLTHRKLLRLRDLLGSTEDFAQGAVTPEFEDLVSTLRQDLGKSGSKLRRDTNPDAG